ncbi:cyclin-dependent kinase 4 inhibitor B [Anoplopoma fimbria]|uniref:cyclin-dependent kinase 4 inhibitor B n=1 Tax=Anoplopoma fimbria TaxID=229290 RepID=UPI0023EB22DE|nr:cyclin-dependent kinase 4 inhibitor B [Anoplopoma fimbria]
MHGSLIRPRRPADWTDRRDRDEPSHVNTEPQPLDTRSLSRGFFFFFGADLVPQIFFHQTKLSKRQSDRFTVVLAADFLDMTLEDKLTTAAATGNTAEVKDLLREGAQVNGENRLGRTALQVVMMGSTPVARLLLSHGADPNVPDRSTGSTPLHDAARTGFLDTVQLLVQFKADLQARDKRNCEPIDVAREHGHAEVVEYLQSLVNGQ